jgi:hypothetical protein
MRSASSSGPAGASVRRSGAALGRDCTASVTQQEGRPVVRLRGQLQPAHRIGPHTRRQPGQHGADVAALERLLQRPQHVGRGQQRAGWPGWPVRPSRACSSTSRRRSSPSAASAQPHSAAGGSNSITLRPCCCNRGQHRRQQAQFTDAGVRQQQLGQRARRPAAAGQFGVQFGKAAGVHHAALLADLVGAPQRRVQLLGPRQAGLQTGGRQVDGDSKGRNEATARAAAGTQTWQRRRTGREGLAPEDCMFIQLLLQASPSRSAGRRADFRPPAAPPRVRASLAA